MWWGMYMIKVLSLGPNIISIVHNDDAVLWMERSNKYSVLRNTACRCLDNYIDGVDDI